MLEYADSVGELDPGHRSCFLVTIMVDTSVTDSGCLDNISCVCSRCVPLYQQISGVKLNLSSCAAYGGSVVVVANIGWFV